MIGLVMQRRLQANSHDAPGRLPVTFPSPNWMIDAVRRANTLPDMALKQEPHNSESPANHSHSSP